MKTMIRISRWIYNQKNDGLREEIALCNESGKNVEIEIVKFEKETDKAVYVWALGLELGIIKFWLPKSQIYRSYEIDENGTEKDIEIVAEGEHQKTTKTTLYPNADEAQAAIDHLKEIGKLVKIHCTDNGIEVIEKI